MESQWLKGIVAGTLETHPFTFSLFVTGSVPFFNLTTVILQLVESEKCFQWLKVRGIHPSQFDTVHTFQVCCSDS